MERLAAARGEGYRRALVREARLNRTSIEEQLVAIEERTDRAFLLARLSAPRVLFTESASGLALSDGFAVSRDPSRFLVVRRAVPQGGEATALVLMDGWLDRAQRRGSR